VFLLRFSLAAEPSHIRSPCLCGFNAGTATSGQWSVCLICFAYSYDSQGSCVSSLLFLPFSLSTFIPFESSFLSGYAILSEALGAGLAGRSPPIYILSTIEREDWTQAVTSRHV
jgi:hypothetical protein